jgi:molecular chaperone Hsp33
MIVVDVRTPGQIRATASFNEAAIAEAAAEGRLDAAELLGRGTLAMTVEQGHSQQRYQGYVPLQDESLEAAAHTYFRQSEQIPTRIRLAVAEMFERDEQGVARQSWRAGGIIGQFLPVSEDRVRRRDLPAGDVPEGRQVASEADNDDDAWVEAQALIDTVEDHELTDPAIAAERLLYRLFHERGVRVFEPILLEENCSCSRQRIEQVLVQMTPEEIEESAPNGSIEVRCEFCGTQYRFSPAEFLPEAPEAQPDA